MSNTNDKTTARSVFFELLERRDFEEGRHWQRQCFKNGETILAEGGYSGKIYLVLAGATRVLGTVTVSEDYQVRPGVRDLGPGEVFGELSMLDNAPHSASVIAIDDSELAVLDSRLLLAFLENHRELGYAVFRELAQTLVDRLRKTDKKVFSLMAWGFKAHGYDKYMRPDS
jgi:CRP/FNR family cyclic AMP-dependent transcriptional regulator